MRKIEGIAMGHLEFGGFGKMQAKIAKRLGAPTDGYTIIIVAANYFGEKTDDTDTYVWRKSSVSYGWEPDAEEEQQAVEKAQRAALTYAGDDPECFCATVEDDASSYLIIGLIVIGPDAKAGRLELEGYQVKEDLDAVFDDISDDGPAIDCSYDDEEPDFDDEEEEEPDSDDEEEEESDYFVGAVKAWDYEGDPIPDVDPES